MITVDTSELVACIHKCFMFSLDERLSDTEQRQMNALGKQLRGNLINLLSAMFEDDLKQVDDANKQLKTVNDQLTATNDSIDKVDETISTVTKLVKTLDKLLLVVAKFV